MSNVRQEWPLWEVFVRSKSGLDHKHCGSLHAAVRARGWAVLRALSGLLIADDGDWGLPNGKPTWGPPARRSLERLVASLGR